MAALIAIQLVTDYSKKTISIASHFRNSQSIGSQLPAKLGKVGLVLGRAELLLFMFQFLFRLTLTLFLAPSLILLRLLLVFLATLSAMSPHRCN